MHTKRIIPCLDVKNGTVVKGINFKGLKEVGDPVNLAKEYYNQGADELVFLDITATYEKRKTIIDVVERVSEKIFIPFTVGGGISTLEEIREILRAGADKISLNSAAIRNPKLIQEGAYYFGNQCMVVAVDAKKKYKDNWTVYINGGRVDTGIDLFKWIEEAHSLGAGEILLTSMDADGTKNGFDIEVTNRVSTIVDIPVIASGGCGRIEDFKDVFLEGKADAALAASLFHYGNLKVSEVKEYLRKNNIEIRL